MRITLTELASDNPAIDRLEILSLEGQVYMARLHTKSELKVLSDATGKTVLMKSAWQIQDRLRFLDIARTEVVHASAYDEMIGMAPSADEPLRIRIEGQGK